VIGNSLVSRIFAAHLPSTVACLPSERIVDGIATAPGGRQLGGANMNTQRINRLRLVATAGVLATVLVPLAGAGIDGRSPDTKDAAAVARTAALDLRSPDTRDAALTAQSGTRIVLGKEDTPALDLRSPDTRDAGVAAHSNGSVVVLAADSQRFDWTDAGIGAAGGFAIALILAGTFVLMRSTSRDKLAL
jgi:hypothetical protein